MFDIIVTQEYTIYTIYMLSSFRVKLGVGLGCAGGVGVYVWHRRSSACIERCSFLQQAVDLVYQRDPALLPPSSVIPWYSTFVHTDAENNCVHATIRMDRRTTVRATARRDRSVPLSQDDQSLSPYDDSARGIAYYWEQPWEIKADLVRGTQNIFRSVKDFLKEYSDGADSAWTLTSVAVNEEVLLGDKLLHPFFASRALNPSASSPRRSTAQYLLGLLSVGAVSLISHRMYSNLSLRPAFTFCKEFVARHPAVRQYFGDSPVEIASRTGEFSKTRIKAELSLVAKDSTSECVVKIEAVKKDAWQILSATLNVAGGTSNKPPVDLLAFSRIV